MQQPLSPTARWLVFAGIGLFFYSYLSHLGSLPVDIRTDEGRRVLVSAEMILSGNYLVPTINGALFLNKPPLYNWIMVAAIKLGGSYDPFWLRLPVFVAIALFGVLIYRFVKLYTNATIATVAAFAFVTNGRILIYDSLQSFIDLSFGVAMYAQMMLMFHFGSQKKYRQLFLWTYLLTAAGFLMKGMPALVFEGITLLTYFGYSRRFKVLFGGWHVSGILLAALIMGAYYYAYFSITRLTPAVLFTRLLTESTDRTAVKFGLLNTVWHFLYYPFEMMYHYAPWLLLVTVFFQKNIFKAINGHPFIKYNWWVFLANFLVYWTSPQVYARYLFPLLPMLLTVMVYLFYTQVEAANWRRKLPEIIAGAILTICVAAFFVLPFIKAASAGVEHAFLKAFLCGLLLAAITLGFWKRPAERLLLLAMGLLVIRMAFNWFVIDQRGLYLRQMEAVAQNIAVKTAGKPLFLENGAHVGNFDGMSFFISTRRNALLTVDSTCNKAAYYITDSTRVAGRKHDRILEFDNPYADHLYLVQYK